MRVLARFLAVFVAPWVASPAMAGNGPWVLGVGDYTVFAGLETQRFTQLQTTGGADLTNVGEGVTSFAFKAIGTYGLLPRFEMQAGLPYASSHVNRDDEPNCAGLGLEACETSEGIGILTVRGKVLILDELFGAPVSVATGIDTRFGQLVQPYRARLTSLGDGTFDVGTFVNVGRAGGLGKTGFWSAYGEIGWRYRFPSTTGFPTPDGEMAVPGDEFTFDTQALFAPDPRFAFGPLVNGFWRYRGVDFSETDLSDPDRFVGLNAASIQVGGQILIRDTDSLTFVLSAAHTVFARNNPADGFYVTAGIGWYGRRRAPDEGS